MIAWGHPPSAVWGYTPREIDGFMHFAGIRQKQEAARDLSIGAMASRGEQKAVNKRLKEWTKP